MGGRKLTQKEKYKREVEKELRKEFNAKLREEKKKYREKLEKENRAKIRKAVTQEKIKVRANYKKELMEKDIEDAELPNIEDSSIEYWNEEGHMIYKPKQGSAYPLTIVEKAFVLYMEGVDIPELARRWNIEPSVLYNWCSRYNWRKKLESASTKAEKKYISNRVKKALSERDRADNRHKGIVQWLMTEIKLEMIKPAENKTEVQIKLDRMKILNIATTCYKSLIDQERQIIGINDDKVAEQIPNNFIYKLETPDSKKLESKDELVKFLPSQNPHEYLPEFKAPETIPAYAEEVKPQEEQRTPLDIIKEQNNDVPVEPIVIDERTQKHTAHPPAQPNPMNTPNSVFTFQAFEEGY